MSINVTSAADVCEEALEYFTLVSGGVYTYDARIFKYDYEPFEYWSDFLKNSNKASTIYSTLHATKFDPHSTNVA